MKRTILIIGILVCTVVMASCSQSDAPEVYPVDVEKEQDSSSQYLANDSETEEATGVEEVAPTPAPTPEVSGRATIGAVGYIMFVYKHLAAAQKQAGVEDEDAQDFSFMFPSVQNMLSSVDLMCGNLECTLPGADADGNGNLRAGSYTTSLFGAPDAFAQTLKDAGFDCLTTANNHTVDYGAEGIISTIDTLERIGLYHAGTFRSASDRINPCVVTTNGIKIGIIAATSVVNDVPSMTRDQQNEMIARLQLPELLQSDIAACRNAGAEFVVAFTHWGQEYTTKPEGGMKIYARTLLAAGADAVIGAHPHMVQPFSYETVTRDDGSTYTGLVAYSLGNFITSMNFECSCGLFLLLEIERNDVGKVVLTEASYMPVYCYARYFDEVAFSQMLPALLDPSNVGSPYGGALDEREQRLLGRVRNYVVDICGTDVVPIMEDACWIS